MYKNENFKEFSVIQPGDLTMKLTGARIKEPFGVSKAYLNQSCNIGNVALTVRDFEATLVEEEGGDLGPQMVEQLQDATVKKMVRKLLATEDTYLFYSRTSDGKDVITMPGMSGEDGVDDTNFGNTILASYSTHGKLPSVKKVYDLHTQAISDRIVVGDRSMLEKEVLTLVPKAQLIYDRALELMKSGGF